MRNHLCNLLRIYVHAPLQLTHRKVAHRNDALHRRRACEIFIRTLQRLVVYHRPIYDFRTVERRHIRREHPRIKMEDAHIKLTAPLRKCGMKYRRIPADDSYIPVLNTKLYFRAFIAVIREYRHIMLLRKRMTYIASAYPITTADKRSNRKIRYSHPALILPQKQRNSAIWRLTQARAPP